MNICRVVMTTFHRLPYKHSSQVREDKSLDKCHQYFQKIDEYGKQYKQGRCAPAKAGTHRAKNKNQDNKTKDNDVA